MVEDSANNIQRQSREYMEYLYEQGVTGKDLLIEAAAFTLFGFDCENWACKTKKTVPCHCWLEGGGLLLDFADGHMFSLSDVERDISSWFRSREMNEGKPLYIPSVCLTELLYVPIMEIGRQ